MAALAAICLAFGGCAGSSDIESQIREAEMATANGDMTAARSVASHIVGNENLSDMPASQLARLSIVYMQLADTDSTDIQSNVSTAAGLYRRAYETNADSAASYYSTLPPDKLPYARLLSILVGNIDNPYDMASDTLSYGDTVQYPDPDSFRERLFDEEPMR